jgi:F-type H+-transporting ATPase subunit a
MAGNNPISQFEINRLIPMNFLGYDISLTNSAVSMIIAVCAILYIMWPRTLGSTNHVPSKWQLFQEMFFGMVYKMVADVMGLNGKKFFPFIFTLFLFILSVNMFGMMPLPFAFTATSHIAVTGVLAVMVLCVVLITGILRNGLHYFAHFAPKGVPFVMLILIVPIEIISFLARPITLAVRLCGNMAAGHIVLKIFASFIVMLSGAGILGLAGILPFTVLIALNALEFFVAFLQAYIFTTLTCIYLSESVVDSH